MKTRFPFWFLVFSLFYMPSCDVPDSTTVLGRTQNNCTSNCNNTNNNNNNTNNNINNTNNTQAVCGDGRVEGTETCEGDVQKACTELGNFQGGMAACVNCQWDLSSCEAPPDRIQDPSCGTHLGNQERDEFRSFPEERVLGDSPTPQWIRLSWRSEPAISMTVTWTTRDSSAETMTRSTVLRVSRNADMSNYIEISGQNSGAMVGSARTLPYNSAWKTVHEAEICGLDPDTRYYYQVGGIGADGREVFSSTYHFRTAPDPRQTPDRFDFTFVVLGDSRGAPDTLGRTLAKAFENENPLFVSFGGDFVEDGTSQRQWDDVFNACANVMPYVPILPVPGNHERSSLNYYAQFSLPGDERWYGFSVGHAVFANLDDCWSGAGKAGTYGVACSGAMTAAASAKQDQVNFMNTLFSAHAQKPWKFVVHHRPIYSETTDFTHGGWTNTDLAEAWRPVFDAHNVTMVFNGHDHFYQRHKPLRNDTVVDDLSGRHYVVTAGAGASLYDVKTGGTVAVTKSAVHYVAVRLRGLSIEMRSVEIQPSTGNVAGTIDTLSFSR